MKRRLIHIIIGFLAVSIVLFVTPGSGTAQTDDAGARPLSGAEKKAADSIRRAGERFELAMALTREGRGRNVEPARIILGEAKTQLDHARENFDDEAFESALRFADSSEQLSDRAIDLLRRDVPDPGMVEKEIVRTELLLERIRSQARKPVPRPLRRRFDEAVATQENAKRHFDRGDTDRALELTRKSRRMVTRLAAKARPGSDPHHVTHALRLTDGLIKEARDMARRRNSERLMRQVREADEFQMRARRQLERHNYGDAFRLSLKARAVLKEAIGSDRPSVNEIEVRDALVTTDEEIRRIRGIVGDAPDRETTNILEQALDEQKTAWEQFNARRHRDALARTRVARNLARQALTIGVDDTD
jgi:hypothetical protein